ncbi:SH3 and cysteine-rich domain-containing protein-like [Triplophysa dalaica]|uniref:SH3 and cysteine-rich domain-containing protein-like n=1 Tax=Triplophysa dalaica TaxID=1582913 RepID=UPI0024DFB65C|nr:SH3 and cysteine-rich domain-containing protein-like [Triplophysa dalaica]
MFASLAFLITLSVMAKCESNSVWLEPQQSSQSEMYSLKDRYREDILSIRPNIVFCCACQEIIRKAKTLIYTKIQKSNRDLKRDLLQLNTYVALFRFTPQDSQDLEMRPGDRIIVADDSNDDWWKGVIDDRIGFFPVSYTQQVKAGDRVFRCNRTFIGCKEQGQITLKEGQICVSSEDESNGFISVASGKKRGFVPCDVLENK